MNIIRDEIYLFNNETMNELNSFNYLEKQQALKDAGNVMEHALQTIANIFKNFQADYLSLIDDNKKLQVSLKNLQKTNNDFCHVCGKNSNRNGKIQTDYSNSADEEGRIIEDFENRDNNAETLEYIESTQIEKQILPKCNNRQLYIRPNSQKNKLNRNENKVNDPNAQLNSNKRKTIIPIDDKSTECKDVVLELEDDKTHALIHENEENNTEIESEYLNIDATLFEQPFSQESNSNIKAEVFIKPDDSKSIQNNSSEMSETTFIPDEVVETSPKKNLLRKKNWLRLNRQMKKSCTKNSNRNTVTISGIDGNKKDLHTSQSSKCPTSREQKDRTSKEVVDNETKVTIENQKTKIFPQQTKNKNIFPVLINKSIPLSQSTSSVPTQPVPAIDIIKIESNEQTSGDVYLAADETYFPGYEQSVKANFSKKSEEIMKKAKRKFADIIESSNIVSNNNVAATSELELDIGEMSDWDTDISCDKWPTDTPQKRVLLNSFDIVPMKKEKIPKFATKGPVVRNKLARAKLPGWDCENCAQYYGNMKLTEKELQERKNKCSRHRSKFNERYYTPPGLWDLRFPDTQNSSQE